MEYKEPKKNVFLYFVLLKFNYFKNKTILETKEMEKKIIRYFREQTIKDNLWTSLIQK